MTLSGEPFKLFLIGIPNRKLKHSTAMRSLVLLLLLGLVSLSVADFVKSEWEGHDWDDDLDNDFEGLVDDDDLDDDFDGIVDDDFDGIVDDEDWDDDWDEEEDYWKDYYGNMEEE